LASREWALPGVWATPERSPSNVETNPLHQHQLSGLDEPRKICEHEIRHLACLDELAPSLVMLIFGRRTSFHRVGKGARTYRVGSGCTASLSGASVPRALPVAAKVIGAGSASHNRRPLHWSSGS
jgi:hypothetical protein